MSDLALDLSNASRNTGAFGDLALGPTGDLMLTSGTDAVRQALALRLEASVGDYFMAPTDGIAWLEMLGSTAGYTDSFDAVLRNTTQNTPGVYGLLGWVVTANRAAKTIAIAMELSTASGVTNYSVDISESGVV